MSESKTGPRGGKTRRFSDFRCVRCHHYLVPLTEEKMNLFNFTPEQREKVRKFQLDHFCPVCMRGYQRTDPETKEPTER